LNGIVWGKADRSQYTGIVYRVTIEEILKRADGVAILRKGVAEARKSMKDGDVILNTNLPTTVLEVIA
jgi:hypothetical protein